MNIIKLGITGQVGFVGSHLYNTLSLFPLEFELIEFNDDFFYNEELLENFVSKCDVLVHLAAVNRHEDINLLYNTNIELVSKLISACKNTNSKPHILFSSSIQEEINNLYGKSKKEGRLLFENWAKENYARFTGLVIPNVFGPFGKPYYNSVISTFSYQLTHNEVPKIDKDNEMKLIYVGELINNIIDIIKDEKSESVKTIYIPYTTKIRVSDLLSKMVNFKELYFEKGIIPNLNDVFDRNLFVTFVSYIEYNNFFPFMLKSNEDERGVFTEVLKLNSGGQISFSTTKSGVTRGNHFHIRKFERFAVIKGKAKIEIRKIDNTEVLKFELDGNKPSFVDMPIWYTHNITNIGDEELYTIFWINEHFIPEDSDTFFKKV